MKSRGVLAAARLVSVLRRVDGRKRLQKIAHILKCEGFAEFDQKFALHYFGPFSNELAGQVDFAVSTGLIQETKEGETFVYTAHDLGNELSSSARFLNLTPKPKWADLAMELDKNDTAFLEALSTLVFLSEAGFAGPKLRQEFVATKPQLQSRFRSVDRYAKDHKFI